MNKKTFNWIYQRFIANSARESHILVKELDKFDWICFERIFIWTGSEKCNYLPIVAKENVASKKISLVQEVQMAPIDSKHDVWLVH